MAAILTWTGLSELNKPEVGIMTMDTLSNDFLLLKKLTFADSESFYDFYSMPEHIKNYDTPPVKPDETAVEFTSRIIESCNYIWTIRLISQPETIIGDCALHHWDKSNRTIEIGGALLPLYWGKNLMKRAFELIIVFAVNSLQVHQIIGKTSPQNKQAIRMVEKLGFTVTAVHENVTVLRLNCLFINE